jgi:hypothetical protein
MGVTPSSVDRDMYTKYEETAIEDGDYYIFMILNKKGEMFVELYDTVTNAIYYKNDIIIETEGVEEFIKSTKDNIRIKTTQQPQQQTQNQTQKPKSDYDFENCKNDCGKCTRREDCYEYYMTRS